MKFQIVILSFLFFFFNKMTQPLPRTLYPVQERNIKKKREENGDSSNKETEVYKQVN